MSKIVVIAHNLRSSHNVGSLLRTADGLGIHKIYLTGYTPYPRNEDDERMPHIARKVHKQISKTALGAEETVSWENVEDVFSLFTKLKNEGYTVAALEQTPNSTLLPSFAPP